MTPTLFDFTNGTVTPGSDGASGSYKIVDPYVRRTDPETSRLAAEAVQPGCKECIDAIRLVAWLRKQNGYEPATAFDFARVVNEMHNDRWDEGTIRRRVKDADLIFVDKHGVSPRGRACERWTL